MGRIINEMCEELGKKNIPVAGKLKYICEDSASLIDVRFNEINIGTPILASLYAGPSSTRNKRLCSDVVLIGFVESIKPVTDRFGNKNVIFSIANPPSGYTTDEIKEWANSLGFGGAFASQLLSVFEVRDILESLFPNIPATLQLAYDLSLELGSDESLKDKLKPYAEKVKKVMSMVTDELIKEKLYSCLDIEMIDNCFYGDECFSRVDLESDTQSIFEHVLECVTTNCRVRNDILSLFPNLPTIYNLVYNISTTFCGGKGLKEEVLVPYAEKVNKVFDMVKEELAKEKLYHCLDDKIIDKCFEEMDLEYDVKTIYEMILECTKNICAKKKRR